MAFFNKLRGSREASIVAGLATVISGSDAEAKPENVTSPEAQVTSAQPNTMDTRSPQKIQEIRMLSPEQAVTRYKELQEYFKSADVNSRGYADNVAEYQQLQQEFTKELAQEAQEAMRKKMDAAAESRAVHSADEMRYVDKGRNKRGANLGDHITK